MTGLFAYFCSIVMKAAFLILSAINQVPATASAALTQLQQCVFSLNRDYEACPIAVIEYAEEALNPQQKQALLEHTDLLAEFKANQVLQDLKASGVDAQAYQALLKIVALNWFLQNAQGAGLFNEVDYVVVIEDGVALDKSLIHLLNQSAAVKNKFFFKKAVSSASPNEKAKSLMHYPTEQWAYAAELTEGVIDDLIEALENAYHLLQANDNRSATDLGQELFKAVDLSKVHFLI